MNLHMLIGLKTKEGRNILVDFVHRSITIIGRETITSLQGAAEKDTEVFVQVGQQGTDGC